jgi:Uma2 family endonuclease
MATAPTVPLVSVDEYLNTSYEQDMEYVDGVLVERGMPTVAHSLLQRLLMAWFLRFDEEMGFMALQDVRTQIIERARYRIPDTMLCPLPLPEGKVCDIVPRAVIEVLSPDDTLVRTRDRFEDYSHIGVHALVLMDPERLIAYRFDQGSLIVTQFKQLALPGGQKAPFDSEELFQHLRAKTEVQQPLMRDPSIARETV